MRALVVYESCYGNSQQVAEAVRDGLAETMEVDLRNVGDTGRLHLGDYALIVVGGPTHALSMSTPESRAQAQGRKPTDADRGSGIRDWLPHISADYAGAVAAFDTRSGKHRRWAGSASRAVEKELRRAGVRLLDRRSFLVATATGPLRDGELYQARLWATGLGVRVRTATHSRPGTGVFRQRKH